MFATQEFIEISDRFVCLRLETYENRQSESLVKWVNGRLANTAFAILDPSGAEFLTRGSRSPSMSLSANRGKTDTTGRENPELISKMKRIAARFQTTGKLSDAVLQDFHSLRQALNCASAEQRLLVVVSAAPGERKEIEQKLKSVFSDRSIVGRFHLDFVDPKSDKTWARIIHDAKPEPGIFIVRSGQFGLDGSVIDHIDLNVERDQIKRTLLEANTRFAETEKPKDYESHVLQGKRQGVYFENEISRRGTDGTGGKANRSSRRRRGGGRN